MLNTLELFRGFERLIIAAGGAFCIYLGYRLLLALPNRQASEGKVTLPGGVSLYVTRVGPATFFVLFGAAILIVALWQSFSFTHNGIETSYVGQGPVSNTSVSVDDATILLAMEHFNELRRRLKLAVETTTPLDIDDMLRIHLLNSIRPMIDCALARLWDTEKWGPKEDFDVWVLSDRKTSPPVNVPNEIVDLFKDKSSNQ